MSTYNCPKHGTPTGTSWIIFSNCGLCNQEKLQKKQIKLQEEQNEILKTNIGGFSGGGGGVSSRTPPDPVSTPTEFPFTAKQVVYFVSTISIILFVYYLILGIKNLLSTPWDLPYPHKIFAYFYHYIFIALYEVGSFLIEVIKIIWNEINFISAYKNLNLVLAIICCSLFVFLLGFSAFKIYKKLEGEISIKDLSIDKRIFILIIVLIPVPIWITYWIFESIIKWLFHA